MENEENKGLIHKKVSEDQLVTFCHFSFGALSLFSFFDTLRDLEFSWSTLRGCGILGFLEQEGKGRVEKHKRASRSTTTLDFSCRYRVACMFSSLVLACMEYACGLLILIYH